MAHLQDKDIPKKNDPKTLLQDGLSEYRAYLEPGDHKLIAAATNEKLTTVRSYLYGNIGSTDTGTKILAAMRKLILGRTNAIAKLRA